MATVSVAAAVGVRVCVAVVVGEDGTGVEVGEPVVGEAGTEVSVGAGGVEVAAPPPL